MNLRLRVHLPLIVPSSCKDSENCGIRCGASTRRWEEGKCLVLDDSYYHDVWNNTDESRVVLLVDLWHPDVQQGERECINDMFSYSQEMGWMT